MRVKDIMNNRPVTVSVGATVGVAARLLAHHGITALPVLDPRARLIGVLSEVDLLDDRARPDAPVRDVMSTQLIVVHPETDLVELKRIFTTTVAKSVPVVDASDQVVGVVSRSDVVRALGRSDEELAEDVVDALVRAGIPKCRVQVHNGIVELTADDGLARATLGVAAAIAEGRSGVRAVHTC